MHQRQGEREGPARAHGDRRVGLFIDFESLRRGLDENADLLDIGGRLRELAQEQGRVLTAAAYADWTQLGNEARDFRANQIEPRMVLGHEPSDDPAALVLALDVQESLYLGPDFDRFVIVGGDYAFTALAERLRRADRETLLVAFEAAAQGLPLHPPDRFVALEELLQGRRPAPRRAISVVPGPAATPPLARKTDFSGWDWAPFVRLLDELEANMPFVGFGWLLKKKLNPENSGCYSIQDKQELMDRAVEEGILTLYKVDNIEEGGDPVTACKLDRDSARVREILS